MIQEYIEQKDSKIVFRGHGVFTIDPQTKEVLWYLFDSYGFPPESPARGRFEGGVLTLTRVTARGSNRYVYKLTPDEFEFSIELKLASDADFKPFMTGEYARKDD